MNERVGENTPIRKSKKVLLFSLFLYILFPLYIYGEPIDASPEQAIVESGFHLKKAVMCERLKGSEPINPTIVFPGSTERAFCFNVFDPVLKATTIYHNWYYKDKIISRFKRSLQPPRWETYSSHKIGSKVKGPWRVEITEDNGNIISVLRFGVSD